MAPPKSSWPPLGAQDLRRSRQGFLITRKSDRLRPRPAPAAQPPPAVRLDVSLFPLVPDQRTLKLVHRSWRLLKEGSEGPLFLTGRPEEASLGRRKVACGLESRLDPAGVGVGDEGSSGSFPLEGRFNHHLMGKKPGLSFPFKSLSQASFPDQPPSPGVSARELPAQGSKVRPSLGPGLLPHTAAGMSAGVAQSVISSWTPTANQRIDADLGAPSSPT